MTVSEYMQNKPELIDTPKEFRVLGKGKRKYDRIEKMIKPDKFKITTLDNFTVRYITGDTQIFFL